MKKKFLAFALAASLLLVLVGCGEDKTPADDTNGGTNGNGTTQNGTNNGTGNGTNNGTNTDNGANGGLANDGMATDGVTGDDLVDDGLTGSDTNARARMGSGDTVFTDNYGSTFGHAGTQVQNERMPGTVYDGTQWPARQTATWSQMLDNGFVHDSDGFLLDGENSSW